VIYVVAGADPVEIHDAQVVPAATDGESTRRRCSRSPSGRAHRCTDSAPRRSTPQPP